MSDLPDAKEWVERASQNAQSAMDLATQFIKWARMECGVDPKLSPSRTATTKAP